MDHLAQFGHGWRADFRLAQGIDHLNHGAFGATPRVVLAAAARWRERMEVDPAPLLDALGAAIGPRTQLAVFHPIASPGAAVIWCSPQRQAALHPPVISHGYGQGFAAEFDWTGTRDYSSRLAAPTALDYIESFGAEHGITVGIAALDGALWVRVSAQIYNEIDDYRRLAAIGRTLTTS